MVEIVLVKFTTHKSHLNYVCMCVHIDDSFRSSHVEPSLCIRDGLDGARERQRERESKRVKEKEKGKNKWQELKKTNMMTMSMTFC